MLYARSMFHTTRNDFGNFFIHIISHFSQNTEAIHLTVVQDPTIHMNYFNAQGE